MNCKKGELAIRLFGPIGTSIPNGSIVKVYALRREGSILIGNTGKERHVRDLWLVEFRGKVRDDEGLRYGVPDCELRPIRDPGDDAKDESLAWLPPLPTQTRETV